MSKSQHYQKHYHSLKTAILISAMKIFSTSTFMCICLFHVQGMFFIHKFRTFPAQLAPSLAYLEIKVAKEKFLSHIIVFISSPFPFLQPDESRKNISSSYFSIFIAHSMLFFLFTEQKLDFGSFRLRKAEIFKGKQRNGKKEFLSSRAQILLTDFIVFFSLVFKLFLLFFVLL